MKAKLFFLFSFLLLLCALWGCGKEAKEENTLTLVTSANFPPYEFLDRQKIVGIDVDIIRYAAKKLGKELVIIDTKFDSVIGHIVTGKADVAASGITVTEERKKRVSFTIPYSRAAQMILVPRNSPIKGSEDLKKNKRIGCQSGTTAYDYLRQHIITDKNSPLLQQFETPAVAVKALKIGKLDAVVLDEQPAVVLSKINAGDVLMLPQPLTSEEYAIALNKNDSELREFLNAVEPIPTTSYVVPSYVIFEGITIIESV